MDGISWWRALTTVFLFPGCWPNPMQSCNHSPHRVCVCGGLGFGNLRASGKTCSIRSGCLYHSRSLVNMGHTHPNFWLHQTAARHIPLMASARVRMWLIRRNMHVGYIGDAALASLSHSVWSTINLIPSTCFEISCMCMLKPRKEIWIHVLFFF